MQLYSQIGLAACQINTTREPLNLEIFCQIFAKVFDIGHRYDNVHVQADYRLGIGIDSEAAYDTINEDINERLFHKRI